jgi:hypothetical protein
VGNGWIDYGGFSGSVASDTCFVSSGDYSGHPILRPSAETEVQPVLIVVCNDTSGLVRAVNANASDFLGVWVNAGTNLYVDGFGAASMAPQNAALSTTVTADTVFWIEYVVASGTGTLTAKVYDSASVYIDTVNAAVLTSMGGPAATPLATISGTTTTGEMLVPGYVGIASLSSSHYSRVLIYDANPPSTTLSASPSTFVPQTDGNVITLTGVGTSWTSTNPTFTLAATGYGVSITGQAIISDTSVTITVNAGSVGVITITDPSTGDTCTLSAATLNYGMIGDSWAAYYASQLGTDLAILLGRPVSINDRGLSGTQTSDWLPSGSYLPAAVTSIVASGCTFVNFMLGTNDSRTASNISASTYQANLEAIFAYLIANGLKVIVHYSSYVVPGGSWDANSDVLLQSYHPVIDGLVDGVNIFQGDRQLYQFMQANTLDLYDGVHPGSTGITVVALLQAAAAARAMTFSPRGLIANQSMNGGFGE